jgi:hypothetical protein
MKEVRCQGDRWSKEEIRTLKKIFKANSNQAVANVLERTPKAIERKAAKLGLVKTKKYMRTLGRK